MNLPLLLASESVYVLMPFLVLAVYFTNKTKKKRYGTKYALLAIAALAISAAVATILKIIFPEARPLGISFDSFPSRHATVAFTAAALSKWVHVGKKTSLTRALIYLWATAISISRILLEAHHIQDVVAGAVIGWLIGWAFLHTNKFNRAK